MSKELKVLKDAVINRALQKGDVLYFSRAMARLHFLSARAEVSGDFEAELVKFADEFGLFDRTVH